MNTMYQLYFQSPKEIQSFVLFRVVINQVKIMIIILFLYKSGDDDYGL